MNKYKGYKYKIIEKSSNKVFKRFGKKMTFVYLLTAKKFLNLLKKENREKDFCLQAI